jgi:hypothetical protein
MGRSQRVECAAVALTEADALGDPGQTDGVDRVGRIVDWLFRDRTTGKIVIAQFPNIPLIAWLVATVLAVVTTGTAHTVLGYTATVALLVWAGDELLRGVNPFRRMLGAAVLAWEAFSLIRGG